MTPHTIFKIQFVFFALVALFLSIPMVVSFLFAPLAMIDCFSEHHHSPDSFFDIKGQEVILPLLLFDGYVAAFLHCFIQHNKNLPATSFPKAPHKKMYWKTIIIIFH